MNKILLASTFLLLALSVCLWTGVIPRLNYGINSKIPRSANCTSFKCDYSSTPWTGRIDAGLAAIMAENYKRDQNKSLISLDGSRTDVEDARSVWFPLESLKSYIWAIENQNCANDNCKKDTLGLRIYFAKYPSGEDWSGSGLGALPPTYANHHTIFMIPTYKNGNVNFDFDPWDLNCASSPHAKNPKPLGKKDQTMQMNIFFGDPDGKNHGGLIPPGAETGNSY